MFWNVFLLKLWIWRKHLPRNVLNVACIVPLLHSVSGTVYCHHLKIPQICKNGMTKEPCLLVFQWHAGSFPTEKELTTNIRISKCSCKISWEDCSQQRIWKWHPCHLCTVGDCGAKIFYFLIDDKAVIRYVTVSKISWQIISYHIISLCNLIWLSPACTVSSKSLFAMEWTDPKC